MAVIETLEVRFQADMSRLSAELKSLGVQVNTLAQTLDAGKGRLAGSAAGLIQGVADALRLNAASSAAPREAGLSMSERFVQAISQGQARAGLAAQAVSGAANFSNAAAISAARSAGAALGTGFANGISSQYSAVMRAANRIASAAANRIRSALKIHSPSRVSFELGGYFGEGFADGIYDCVRMVETNVSVLASGAETTLATASAAPAADDATGLAGMVQAAVSEALGGTSIVIPLHVDGMKLGEASIQGINRVTRSTGRMMLEI